MQYFKIYSAEWCPSSVHFTFLLLQTNLHWPSLQPPLHNGHLFILTIFFCPWAGWPLWRGWTVVNFVIPTHAQVTGSFPLEPRPTHIKGTMSWGYLTIIPRARMGSQSIAHEAEGRMGYWLRGHEGERNNRFSKIQLVGKKISRQNNFS